MNTIKHAALVLATVGMMSTQAYASETAVKTAPLSPQLSACGNHNQWRALLHTHPTTPEVNEQKMDEIS